MTTYSLVVLLSQFWTKIPQRRERLPTPVIWPGEFHGLQSMGLPRVRHNWAPFTFTFTFLIPCLALTVASSPLYGFLRKQVRWSGTLVSLRIFQFVVIHTVKDFSVVNEAEVDVFLEFSCFLHDSVNTGSLISGSSAFSKPACTFESFQFTYCWSLAWRLLNITLPACEMSTIVQ